MRKEIVEKQTMPNLTHMALGPRTIAVLLAGCWLLAGIGRSDDTLPKGFQVSRYQSIWERNPFTLVTPSLGGPASPFAKLILVNWLHDKGKDILFVEDTDTNEVKKVTKEGGDNADRLRLIEVVPNRNPSLIFAKLTNGREEGIVKFKFDQANAQAANSNLGMPRVPGQAPLGPNVRPFGNTSVGPARRTPAQPAGVNQPNFQQAPANAPNAQEIRRRRMLPTPNQNFVPPNNAPQVNGQPNNNPAAESDDDDD
jgi:hypothetical protein